MGSDQNKAPQAPENAPKSLPKSAPVEGASNRVVGHALAMAFGTSTSRVLGLLREVAFAALFSRTMTDAWIAAFRLPNMFRRLLGEGSLSVSFVPVFVEARVRDGEAGGHRARDLMDGVFTLFAGVLATITVLGTLFPEPLLHLLLDPRMTSDAEAFLMTVHMARIMFGFVFLICLYAFFMGVLNALGSFALPAMAPMLFNVAMIVSTLLPQGWFPNPGDGIAWGVIAGGFLQMGILIPALWKKGYLPRLRFHWTPEIGRVLMNMLPGMLGLGLLQITTLVNMRFASALGEGAISWINWADRLLELPLSLVSVSLGMALLPTLADFWARGERERMSETMNFALRLNLFVSVAAAAGLYMLADPIVEVLFQRGRFTPEDTAATAQVLRIWAMILVPTACVRVLAPSYYAIKNTWFPAVVSALCLIVHVLLAPVLMERWGLTGLNSSSLVTSLLNLTLLLGFYRLLIAEFAYGKVFLSLAKFAVPAAALAGAVLIESPARALLGDGFAAKVVSLAVAIGAGALAFAAVSHLMGLEEWRETAQRFLGRIRRRLAR